MGGMQQEHERAAGAWQAEWSALPDLFRWTAGAVDRVAVALDGVEVFADRLRANLDEMSMAESLSMTLAARLGREKAHALVQAASKRAAAGGQRLREVALQDQAIRAALDQAAIDRALDPENYLGATDTLIDRSLEAWRGLSG
jgi:3-carboxy-cis,cis-muconate cycloisomerase